MRIGVNQSWRQNAVFLAGLFLAQGATAGECRSDLVDDVQYVVCSADPKTDTIRLFWKDTAQNPYRRFSELAGATAAKGKSLVFAMNAGMYSDDFTPVGLYVEEGRELVPANTKTLQGDPGSVPNFYKKPNGIFFIGDGAAGILPTEAFLDKKPKVSFATQSGPMLVIDGKISPIFIRQSSDRTYRSGVGVCDDGMVRFAISNDRVNFYDFASFFKDRLKCANALFLDGGRGTGLYEPSINREDQSGHGGYGPIIGLIK
ncbi:phosphodiester glycosidase family protein [Oryzifoliimicrobium ureilyticus]|uniref:phosphodiester glycosidase family protein n=1 Tax=Oryzifoliimicrobium ureilyticus TaxID=3113724 RepID=UPI0030766C0B